MKKFIDKIKDIWSIEELRNRILLTLGLILVYRLGSFIVLPGMDPNMLKTSQNAQDGLLGLINMFAGGAFNNASIFALGVMPYISASIFMQLAGIVIPQFAKMQKEESGRAKINQYTRYLTILVTVMQSAAYISFLRTQTAPGSIVAETTMFYVSTVVILTAGTLFVMWLGERITDKGIGNGVSILIMVGILARLPHTLGQEITTKIGQDKILFLIIELALFIVVIIGLVLLTQGVRKIPLNYARRIVGNNAAREIGGARDFIPLKVNSAGVMPIIFAQALMFIPSMLAGFSESASSSTWLRQMSDHTSLIYNVIYAVLVIVFTYFYTALIFNPTEMAENLKRNNSFIPGIPPGQPTADYIGATMDRITLPGSIFLAIAGILPGIAALLGVTSGFSTFFGGTSMLIGVAVIIDTIQQIESHLLMRHYDGMMKSGRVTTRRAVQQPS
ncbi:MAG TPA: preprotein translocase subunit SecY [Edaphocola sp.]|nr:preprotein translocase subunit SecY [Edaphocola sp.]